MKIYYIIIQRGTLYEHRFHAQGTTPAAALALAKKEYKSQGYKLTHIKEIEITKVVNIRAVLC